MIFPISVELRHQDWFTEDGLKMAFDALSEKDCGFIITDSCGKREVIHQTMTNKSLMVRFVGQMLHEADFKRIDDWVNKIIEWIDNGLEEIYFFMHQPEPYKYLSSNLASYMIKEFNSKIPNLNLKLPIDYSVENQQNIILIMNEKPPVFNSWNGWHALLIGVISILTILFYVFTTNFS